MLSVPVVLHGELQLLRHGSCGGAKYNITQAICAFLYGLKDFDNLSEEVAPGSSCITWAIMESRIRAAKDEMAPKIRLLRSVRI